MLDSSFDGLKSNTNPELVESMCWLCMFENYTTHQQIRSGFHCFYSLVVTFLFFVWCILFRSIFSRYLRRELRYCDFTWNPKNNNGESEEITAPVENDAYKNVYLVPNKRLKMFLFLSLWPVFQTPCLYSSKKNCEMVLHR